MSESPPEPPRAKNRSAFWRALAVVTVSVVVAVLALEIGLGGFGGPPGFGPAILCFWISLPIGVTAGTIGLVEFIRPGSGRAIRPWHAWVVIGGITALGALLTEPSREGLYSASVSFVLYGLLAALAVWLARGNIRDPMLDLNRVDGGEVSEDKESKQSPPAPHDAP